MPPQKDSKCGVCATPDFERNNYFYGKQFTVRDLLQEQSYFNEKRRLVNRMVLGWGVVCGLDVDWEPEKREFIVQTGMALDCCGREIIVCGPQRVAFEDYEEQYRDARGKAEQEGKFVLCLEYDECHAEPVELPAVGCDDEERTEFNRVRDGFKLRIKKWEDACPKQPYGGDVCLDRFKHDAATAPETPDCGTETIHQHLCRHLKKDCPECEGCDCVVLATIYVRRTTGYPPPGGYQQYEQGAGQEERTEYEQQERTEYDRRTEYEQQEQYGKGAGQESLKVELDTCTDRRLVYNNSLLYDLIHCHHGDLPHIVDFNWRRHTYPAREVEIETFLRMMRDGLTVYFDQEMEEASLNPHTFIVSYLHRESGTGAFIEKRIPVKEIRTGRDKNCYTATFTAMEVWIENELKAPDSELRADTRYEPGVNVQITLRGSRIWSREGKKGLDGEYLADKLPTGNGTQGGDFIDWFRVMPADAKKPKGESYEDY